MSIKTEEAKIVEAWNETNPLDYPVELQELGVWLSEKLADDDWNTVEAMLHKVGKTFATYKASILSECEKCVPEEKTRLHYEIKNKTEFHEDGKVVGHNNCRTQTLQAINSLKQVDYAPVLPVPKYKEGQAFEKKGGDYRFKGVIRSVFRKKNGTIRYVGENEDGLLFIFNEESIRPL